MSTLLVVSADSTSDLLFSLLKDPVVWVTALTTAAIPLLTAASTRPSTPGWFKTLVSFILAGIYALVAWLGGLNGDVDWKTAIVIFVAAAAGAGGLNAAWISGQIATWLGLKVPVNLGPKPMTPEKAAQIHSNNSPNVEAVPDVPLTPVAPTTIAGGEEHFGTVSENPIDPNTWVDPADG
jgi:hypothetical protein